MSNQVARALFFSLHHGLGFRFHHHSHGLVKNVFKPLLSERTALHVLALELFLYNFLSCFFHYGGFLGVFFHYGVFIT